MLFCDNCGRHTPGCSEIRSREVLIHGVSIPVRYKASICSHCGAELYDDEVEEYVMRIAREQFRSKRNMQAGVSSWILAWTTSSNALFLPDGEHKI